MPTRKKVNSPKKSKMTVMVLQIEGEDDTLQEGFRALNTALEAIAGPKEVRVLAAPENVALETPLEFEEEEEVDVTPPSRSSTAPRKAPKSPVVLDLQIKGQSVDLKEFLQPEPESINKKYLLIAYWLKHQLAIGSVSADHIHTCYRFAGMNTPKDATQPLRDMKSKSGWFGKGESPAHYDINHVGENEVRNLRSDVDELPWGSGGSV